MNMNTIGFIFPTIALILTLNFIISPLYLFNAGKGREEKYSYLRYFPCEIASASKMRRKVILIVNGTLMCASLALAYSMGLAGLPHPVFVSAMILYLISAVSLFFIIAYSLENYKGHLIAFSISYVTFWGGDIMMGLMFFLRQDRLYDFSPYIELVLGILGLLLIVPMFLPQLKHWANLEKSEENGKVIYVRPKISPLGFLEWLLIFMQALNMVLFLIDSLIID